MITHHLTDQRTVTLKPSERRSPVDERIRLGTDDERETQPVYVTKLAERERLYIRGYESSRRFTESLRVEGSLLFGS